MAVDPRLAAAAALKRANRALREIEELKAREQSAAAPSISFKLVDVDLVVTIGDHEESLGRVVGRDGESVSLEEVGKLVTDWLEANIKQPANGKSATPEQIAEAVSTWTQANLEKLKGEPGKNANPVDVEALLAELKKTAADWLSTNIKQPGNGRPPTHEEVSAAVAFWMELHLDSRLPSLDDIERFVGGWLSANVRQPDDGKPASDGQIGRAVAAWMAANFVPPKVQQGSTVVLGAPGVGIENIVAHGDDKARFILTDGRHIDLKLPRGKAGSSETIYLGGGSGMSSLQVQQMIDEAFADMGPIEIENNSGDQLRADSGEVEYSPGRIPFALEISDGAGDHVVYAAPADKAFRIRRSKAMPIPRGEEESPQITVKVLNGDDTLYRVLFIEGFVSERQVFTCPVGGKVVVGLDIAARVSGGFNIEEFTP